jgi:hypothetical protein
MAESSTTFLLSAADVSWGRREESCIEVNSAAADLGGEHFLIESLDDDFGSDASFYVWFDLDGSSVDPAPAGRTGIEVEVVTGDDAAAVATKLKDALEAHASFRAKLDSSNSSIVLAEAEFKGKVSAEATDADTGFVFTRSVVGAGGNLGKTSGGVTVSMETTSSDILSDQTGQIVLDQFLTGNTVEASMSLLEMTPENWERVVGSFAGDTFTPSGGSQLVGFGTSKLYASSFDLGGELVLHPTRLDESDRSKNITIWKAAPKPASINFSGEEAQVMEVTFTALPDTDLNDKINMMAFGDNEQEVRA